jgi:enoyl-CoA hydratase/carnithine racemase
MTLRVERVRLIEVLTIDRPQAANALDAAVVDGLAAGLMSTAARRPGELWAASAAARDEFFQEQR